MAVFLRKYLSPQSVLQTVPCFGSKRQFHETLKDIYIENQLPFSQHYMVNRCLKFSPLVSSPDSPVSKANPSSVNTSSHFKSILGPTTAYSNFLSKNRNRGSHLIQIPTTRHFSDVSSTDPGSPMASSTQPEHGDMSRTRHTPDTPAATDGNTTQDSTTTHSMIRDARVVFEEAVNAVLPKEMVAKHLLLSDDGAAVTVQGVRRDLNHNVYVVGFGKAVLGMARAVDDLIGQHIVQGVVSVPAGIQEAFEGAGKSEMLLKANSSIEVREGATNNMPDLAAFEAAKRIADIARDVGHGDLLLVLISGGGSALLPAPCPPIRLSDMLSVTGQMSRGGATIGQLNTVRKQLDVLKGGGLAALAFPAAVVSLVLSDIVGDPLDLIASGPTVPDPSSAQDCLDIFHQLKLSDTLPQSVTDLLRQKAGHVNDANVDRESHSASVSSQSPTNWDHVQNVIIGSNSIACESVYRKSQSLGYTSFVLTTRLEGEAKHVGRMFAHLALFIAGHLNKNAAPDASPGLDMAVDRLVSEFGVAESQLSEIASCVDRAKMASSRGVCLIAGGETTVTVTGSGRGGRNQEMAVAAGLELDELFKDVKCENPEITCGGTSSASRLSTPSDNMDVVFLSAGTDGQDGPTPAAGGVVGIGFSQAAGSMGLNPQDFLDNNDCYSLLEAVSGRGGGGGGGGLLTTGLTGTNVMDVQLLMVTLKHNASL